jgi:hypothetical protein
MPQRFGQADDYSQQYAYLARQNNLQMEAAADRVDRRREEEMAAQDAEKFALYQEGKLSGQEIIAYIESRVRQTSYNKAQQRKWKATLVEFRNQVADERATAAYEATGKIGDFIQHWKKRLSGTKRGTPERTQVQKILSDLREQRDHRNITNGANRIMREIAKGDKSTKDLIAFYRESLKGKGLSQELRSQIQDTIVQLTAKQKQEQYEVAQLKVDEKLARGGFTPQEAAKAKEANALKYGINTIDPVAYQRLQGEIRVLNATPDPVEVAQAEADLKAGTITVADFATLMEGWAEQIAPFDREASWQLRGTAWEIRKEYESAQKLVNPDVIGQRGEDGPDGSDSSGSRGASVVNTFLSKRLAHITQNDGSTYSNLNCAMASAAMMGHTLGITGRSGADYRAITGDVVGGTTLIQAKHALEQEGASGLRYKDGLSFDKWKNNIKQGATSMLSGYLGNMPAGSIHMAGQSYNHAVYVARYDPQKGFLVLNPAISTPGYKGTWISEANIRKFAWTGTGLGIYSRNGSVLMSPKGTLNTKWNKGKTYDPRQTKRTSKAQAKRERAKPGSGAGYDGYVDIEDGLAFISVEAPAQTDKGERYVGQFNPGPNDTAALVEGVNLAQATSAKYHNPDHYERLQNAGIDPGSEDLDTKDEVLEAIGERTAATANLQGWVNGYAQAYTGGDGAVRVVVGSEVRFLTREDVSALERELVIALDGLAMLNMAVGNAEGTQLALNTISDVILTSQALTTTTQTWERGRLQNNAKNRLEAAGDDREAIRAALAEIQSELNEFGENWIEEPEQQIAGPTEDPESPIGEGLQDPDAPKTAQDVAVDQLGQPMQVVGEGEKARFVGNWAADYTALVTQLLDPDGDQTIDQQAVVQFAEMYDLPLPPKWPQLMEAGDVEPPGEGSFLARLADEASTLRNLDRGEGEMAWLEAVRRGRSRGPRGPAGDGRHGRDHAVA